MPDWLSVVDRRCRIRSKQALPWCDAEAPELAEFARGVAQHHHDDGWFHETRAFDELSWQFTRAFREQLEAENGMRPSFLGHILVELLLDDAIGGVRPELLDRYYLAIDAVNPAEIERWVAMIAPRPAEGLARFIALFRELRFLYDYRDDAKLCCRLNQVLRRVGLPEMPAKIIQLLPPAREAVAARMPELLAGAPTILSREEISR